MRLELLQLLERFKAAGNVYHVYPKKKMIALNGFPRVTYEKAITMLKESEEKIALRLGVKNK